MVMSFSTFCTALSTFLSTLCLGQQSLCIKEFRVIFVILFNRVWKTFQPLKKLCGKGIKIVDYAMENSWKRLFIRGKLLGDFSGACRSFSPTVSTAFQQVIHRVFHNNFVTSHRQFQAGVCQPVILRCEGNDNQLQGLVSPLPVSCFISSKIHHQYAQTYCRGLEPHGHRHL